MDRNVGAVARRIAAVCLAGALGASLAGCGMSSITSGLGGGMFGSGSSGGQVKSVTEEQLLTAAKADEGATGSTTAAGEISYGCPRFKVWSRDNNLTVYETGRVGDGLAIMHRGEITKTARECNIQAGRVTVKYGFSGRVLLGPRGKSGRITMPVNVFVTDAKREKVATDKLNIETDVALENPIGYFSAVRTVTFTVPEGSRPGEYEVYVGFEKSVPGAG